MNEIPKQNPKTNHKAAETGHKNHNTQTEALRLEIMRAFQKAIQNY